MISADGEHEAHCAQGPASRCRCQCPGCWTEASGSLPDRCICPNCTINKDPKAFYVAPREDPKVIVTPWHVTGRGRGPGLPPVDEGYCLQCNRLVPTYLRDTGDGELLHKHMRHSGDGVGLTEQTCPGSYKAADPVPTVPEQREEDFPRVVGHGPTQEFADMLSRASAMSFRAAPAPVIEPARIDFDHPNRPPVRGLAPEPSAAVPSESR